MNIKECTGMNRNKEGCKVREAVSLSLFSETEEIVDQTWKAVISKKSRQWQPDIGCVGVTEKYSQDGSNYHG